MKPEKGISNDRVGSLGQPGKESTLTSSKYASDKTQRGNPMDNSSKPQGNPWLKIIVLTAVLLIMLAGLWFGRDFINLEAFANQEAAFRSWKTRVPLLASVIAIAVYVVVTGLSLPGAAIMTLLSGWFFGFLPGLVVVSIGSTAGATVSFLLSRYLLRDWVTAKLKDRVTSIQQAVERDGAFYLFTLRLVPAVPFFVINVVMGLTRMSPWTFWWVSQLGMLPGTAAYVYAGASVPSLKELAEHGPGRVLSWQLILAFAILGFLPLALKRLLAWYSSNRTSLNKSLPLPSESEK
jgi:uncharacterized membrane protein YdjX (TVP38/TMEM64 family)